MTLGMSAARLPVIVVAGMTDANNSWEALMVDFTVHDETSAPDEAKAILAEVKRHNGFLPNLVRSAGRVPAGAGGLSSDL